MNRINHSSRFIEMFGNGNWEQRPLGEVGTFKRGGGFQKSDYVEHGIPCIHYGQIHTLFGPFIYSHISEISSELESKTKFASKGDLIIAITSEDAEGSCKSTAWLGDYPVAVGAHAAIFNHCMDPLYMSFFFKSELFNHAKMEYIHGTKVVEIRPDDIAKILVPCPPMGLQKQFSTIAHQADKSKFNDFKSRFIEDFCNKGYPSLCLNSFAKVITGSTPSRSINEYWLNGTHPWASAQDMGDKFVDKTAELITDSGMATCKLVPAGSLLYVCRGSIGVMSINRIDCATNQSICAAIPDGKICKTEYLYYWLLYHEEEISSLGEGTSFKSLSQKTFANLEIQLPPIDEQIHFIGLTHQADKSKYLN